MRARSFRMATERVISDATNIHRGEIIKGYIEDLETLAVANTDFRRVLYTAAHSQLVLMALLPDEDIGSEVHTLDQFFRIEQGHGDAESIRHRIIATVLCTTPKPPRTRTANTSTGRRRPSARQSSAPTE